MKKKFLTILLILTILVSFETFAQENNIIAVSDRYTQRVTVSGKLISDFDSKWVNVVIINKDDSKVNDDYSNMLASAQGSINEDYSFNVSLTMPLNAPTDTYSALITPQYGVIKRVDFEHICRYNTILALKAVNEQTDGNKTIAKILEKNEDLGIDLDFYNQESYDKQMLENILFNEKGDLWKDASALFKSVKKAAAVLDINKAVTSEELDNALKNYSECSDFIYDDYKAIYISIKDNLNSKLISRNFISSSDFDDYYKDEKIISSVTSCPNWSYIRDILVTDYIRAKLDSSVLSKLDNIFYPQEIYKAIYLARNGLDNINSIVENYSQNIINCYNNEHISSGSTSSGGGGGGGIGGSYTVPKTDMDTNNSTEIFSDIENVQWAKEAIKYLSDKNVINGFGNKEFRPNEYITREQFVKMLVCAFDVELQSGNINFNDISSDNWSADYVYTAVENQIITGMGDGSFGYGMYITRQDLAVMAYRAAKLKNFNIIADKTNYNDEKDILNYALIAVASMQKAGIIEGIGNGNFAPRALATRAQAAKIIYGLLIAVNAD